MEGRDERRVLGKVKGDLAAAATVPGTRMGLRETKKNTATNRNHRRRLPPCVFFWQTLIFRLLRLSLSHACTHRPHFISFSFCQNEIDREKEGCTKKGFETTTTAKVEAIKGAKRKSQQCTQNALLLTSKGGFLKKEIEREGRKH